MRKAGIIVTISIIILSIALIILGITLGDLDRGILNKAFKLCFECIGIG